MELSPLPESIRAGLPPEAQAYLAALEALVAALKASERIVQVRMSYEMPRDPLSLLPYDLIIIPNAPADGFDAPQLQGRAVRR